MLLNSFLGLSAAVRPSVPRSESSLDICRQWLIETFAPQAEGEEPTKSVEKFLQFSCYIDKDVKYLHTGLKNRLSISKSYQNKVPKILLF